MLGDVEDTASLAMIDLVWHALVEGAIALDGDDVATLVGAVEGGERLNTLGAIAAREQIASAAAITLRISHVCVF